MSTKTIKELEDELQKSRADYRDISERLNKVHDEYFKYTELLSGENLPASTKEQYKHERTKIANQQTELTKQHGRICPIITELEKQLVALTTPQVFLQLYSKILDKDEGIEGFMWRHLKLEVNTRSLFGQIYQDLIIHKDDKKMKLDLDDPLFVELVENFEGIRYGRKRLYMRPIMVKLVNNLVSYFTKDDYAPHWLILGGLPGCGKTVTAFMVAILLTSQGTIVVYQTLGCIMLMLSKHVSDVDLATLNSILKTYQVPPLKKETQMWSIHFDKSKRFLSDFVIQERFVFIQDLGEEQQPHIPCRNGNGKRLIVASPNDVHKIAHLDREPDVTSLVILPTWEWEEIIKLETKLPVEIVKQRFEWMGGVPYWVVDWKDEMEEFIDSQVDWVTPKILDGIFRCNNAYFYFPSNMRDMDMVFQIKPTSSSVDDSTFEQNQEFEVVFSSLAVCDKLAERIALNSTDAEILEFVTVCQYHRQTRELLLGRIFERVIHMCLSTKGIDHKIRWMNMFQVDCNRRNTRSAPLNLKSLYSRSQRMQFAKQMPIKQIEDATIEHGVYYYYEYDENARYRLYNQTAYFPRMIDAFVVVDDSFIHEYFPGHLPSKKSKPNDFLVFFKMALAPSHTIDGTVLIKHQTILKEKLQLNELSMLYVFVSWSCGIREWQPVVGENGDTTKPFVEQKQLFNRQYVMRLDDQFNNLCVRCL